MAFSYTTLRSESLPSNYTRTFRYYDCGTGGVIIGLLTTLLDQSRHLRTQDVETFAVGEQGANFANGSFVTLSTENTDGGMQRVVRALAGLAGVLIHEVTTVTTTIQGVTKTRPVREALYYVPGATLSGTDVVVTPSIPPPPPPPHE
jgi:hypothetical protein